MSAPSIPEGWVKARTTRYVGSHSFLGMRSEDRIEGAREWPEDSDLFVEPACFEEGGDKIDIYWATEDGSSFLLVYGYEVEVVA